ncbi:EVE domain-containing protein [Prochlorothrix hollandica]|uniref:EVE domain-containing protein n=1 Tax=Prochlorothrix hollandica TaxID=1223 RepID=UPI000345BE66
MFWLFQGNPKYYKVTEAIRDFEQVPWTVTRYAKEMQLGEGVLVWQSGAKAGIYAIAAIVGLPELIPNPPDIGYWIDQRSWVQKPCSRIRFNQKLLDRPLLRSELQQDPVLKDLMVIRQPNSTNFKVTAEQWQRVFELRG